ncbi:hypothetical protein BCR44DRAFT_1457912 [Catenaria anguillulae PL171]|uniref:Uncharacterized protein n=1 Tax=Catenaria anguillulae PL171 TaxID=765915 RepID=A0A1Y2I0G1_9FUNG|nr:hypothetical protein BCR44DRAFT_1457912 [Catenaria anguillulae PL171]
MFGVRDPYSPTFAATMAVSTNARPDIVASMDASRVLEWMRKDVVHKFVWKEDDLPLSGHFVSCLFDWVEEHGRDTPADRVRAKLPKQPRATHKITAAGIDHGQSSSS